MLFPIHSWEGGEDLINLLLRHPVPHYDNFCSPLFAFSRHCVLSGRTQRRALSTRTKN